MATSKDVAKLAGVSRATVSAVINKNRFVGKEVEKKVKDAIKQLNYRPDSIARSLKVKYTKTLGVIIPNISSPAFSYSVRGIEDHANKNDYNIILCNSDEDYKKEREILEVLLEKRVDGLLMIPTGSRNKEFIEDNIIASEKALVFLDRKIKGLNVDVVIGDNIEASYNITKFLIDSGYRNIATITHNLETSPGIERLEGYKKALTDNGITINDSFLKHGGSTEEDGYKLTKELIINNKARPDSIVVSSNYLMLLGVLKYLDEQKIIIPDDIGLVGFDDLPWLNYMNPPLTVNSLPMHEIGKKACEILLNRITNESSIKEPEEILFKTKLIIRKSTKNIFKSEVI